MNKIELARDIRAFIAPQAETDDVSAPGLKLLRLAEAALVLPDDVATAGHNCWENEAVKAALAERDTQVETQDKLIAAVLDAMGMTWDDADDLPIRIAKGKRDLALALQIISESVEAANLHYPDLSLLPANALQNRIAELRDTRADTLVPPTAGYVEPDSFLPDDVPGGLAEWVSDAIDLAHAVCGNLSPENRVMAKAAQQIILLAPHGDNHG